MESPFTLSTEEKQRFNKQGWIGPYRLFSAEQAAALAPELERCYSQTRGFFYPDEVEPGMSYYADTPWFQSLHALSPQLCAVGQSREIVDRVVQLIGEDVLLWGGIRFAQGPNEALHWHTDTEFDHVDGVGIWLGIEGVTPENALKIIPGSDQFSLMPEDVQMDGSVSMEELVSDEFALSLARRCNNDASIIRPPLHNGEFFIFKGKTWHASDNPCDTNRVAMGLRYSPTHQAVRTPLTYLHPIQWDPTPPPCVVVNGSGEDSPNRIIQVPSSNT